jgi:hypothetical protein
MKQITRECKILGTKSREKGKREMMWLRLQYRLILWLCNNAFSAVCVIHYSVTRQDNLESVWKEALVKRCNSLESVQKISC